MSREMEDWINSDAPAKRDGHLGLHNVINILKIYYGQEYGVKAAVTEDGTTITLRLPVPGEGGTRMYKVIDGGRRDNGQARDYPDH